MEIPKSVKGEDWKIRRMVKAEKDCTVHLYYDKYGQKILVALVRPFNLSEYKRRKHWNRLR